MVKRRTKKSSAVKRRRVVPVPRNPFPLMDLVDKAPPVMDRIVEMLSREERRTLQQTNRQLRTLFTQKSASRYDTRIECSILFVENKKGVQITITARVPRRKVKKVEVEKKLFSKNAKTDVLQRVHDWMMCLRERYVFTDRSYYPRELKTKLLEVQGSDIFY